MGQQGGRMAYVDAEIASETHRDGFIFKTFGPFSSRALAEQALLAFIARENARGAIIRDPHAGTR